MRFVITRVGNERARNSWNMKGTHVELPRFWNGLGVRWEVVELFRGLRKMQGMCSLPLQRRRLTTSKRTSPDPCAKKFGLKLVAAFGPVSYRDYIC